MVLSQICPILVFPHKRVYDNYYQTGRRVSNPALLVVTLLQRQVRRVSNIGSLSLNMEAYHIPIIREESRIFILKRLTINMIVVSC